MTIFTDGVFGVNFSGTNAVLKNINGVVDFRGVNLSSVSFQDSELSQAMFDDQTIYSEAGFGVNFSGTNAVLQNINGVVDFSGVNLSSVSFQNSELSQATFDNSKFDNSTVRPDEFDPIATGAVNIDTGVGTNGNYHN